MDLDRLNQLLECLHGVNSTFLNESLDLSDYNDTCGEEHFIPQEPPARPKGKHRDGPHDAHDTKSLMFLN